VGGNLIRPLPLFAGCESLNGAACADVVKNIRHPFYIGDQPAGTEVSGWLVAWTPPAKKSSSSTFVYEAQLQLNRCER